MSRALIANIALRQRVRSRDRLIAQITEGGAGLRDELLGAMHAGDSGRAEGAIRRNELQLATLSEELRVYQAELHAQADELEASRERTEQALSRFTTLFMAMPVAALVVDGNGELLEHNGQAERLFALQRPTVAARFLHRFVDREQFQRQVRPAFHQARALGSITLDEVGFVTEEGRRFVGELHLATLPGGGASPQFAAAIIDRTEHLQDVRALRDSAEALRVREAFLAGSARLARVGGWEYDATSGAMRWSPQLRSVFGLGADEPATLARLLEFCCTDGRGALLAALHAAQPGHPPFDFELDMRDAAGQPLRVRVVGDADCGEDGPRVLGVFQDVSGQAQARRRIGELTERLGVANDAGGIGVWDWNLLAGTLHLDGRMRALAGVDAVAEPVPDLVTALAPRVHAEDLKAFERTVREAVQTGAGFGIELRLACAGAGESWLHLAGRALGDCGSGHCTRLVGCAWDTTAEHERSRLVAAKQAAEAANRAKTVFLSRVSHELRTPLNAILGFSQLMRLEADDGDLVLKPQRVRMVEDAARHLLELVNELLDVSGIESGQLALKRVAFDLRPLVQETLQLVTPQAAAMRLTLADGCQSGPALRVFADPLRTREVLLNLLSNAVKYNRPGGSVSVWADQADGRVVLTVADTGRGMSAEQIGELFQPFSRAGVECSGIPGSGIGLYFSKCVVEAMGGRIGVESVPGERSAFSFELDAAPEDGAAG